jgi:hypothetical protein
MAKKKKADPGNQETPSEEAGREFGVSLKELETLMQTRGHDGVKELNEVHGGLSGLGQRLKTNLITGKNSVSCICLTDGSVSFRSIRRRK